MVDIVRIEVLLEEKVGYFEDLVKDDFDTYDVLDVVVEVVNIVV